MTSQERKFVWQLSREDQRQRQCSLVLSPLGAQGLNWPGNVYCESGVWRPSCTEDTGSQSTNHNRCLSRDGVAALTTAENRQFDQGLKSTTHKNEIEISYSGFEMVTDTKSPTQATANVCRRNSAAPPPFGNATLLAPSRNEGTERGTAEGVVSDSCNCKCLSARQLNRLNAADLSNRAAEPPFDSAQKSTPCKIDASTELHHFEHRDGQLDEAPRLKPSNFSKSS